MRGRTPRTGFTVVVGLAIAMSVGCVHQSATVARTFARKAQGPELDVERANLRPEEELARLLQGVKGIGPGEGTARVAVPPFRVLGGAAGEGWAGEAAAEVVSGSLVGAENISVLERGEIARLIEELKRDTATDPDVKKATAAGKLLGAKQLVLGTMISASGGYRVVAKTVDVESGVVSAVTQQNIARGEWGALAQLAKEVATHLGAAPKALKASGPGSGPGLARLEPDRVELVARARDLVSKGELAAALPLYQKALDDHPTSAWHAEADYVRLLADVGMTDVAKARAATLLAAMPKDGDTMCDRARLSTQRARDERRMTDARAAVREAASCGDHAVIAGALGAYVDAAGHVSAPLARAALAQADKERAAAGVAVGCEAERQRLTVSMDHDLLEPSDTAYEEVAKRCIDASDWRNASWALRGVARITRSAEKAQQSLDRAVTFARRAGGAEADAALSALAENERRLGRPSRADELVLEAMGIHLRAIAEAAGGLKDPEARLDRELLGRAKVTSTTTSPEVPENRRLLVQAHRRALGRLLEGWAERTRPESKPQADFYADVARALSPTEAKREDDTDRELARRLAVARVPLEVIENKSAPLWGTDPNVDDAFWALWDAHAALRGAKATPERLGRVASAAHTVAEWLGIPNRTYNALRLEAWTKDASGQREAALGLLRSAGTTATTTPWGRMTASWNAGDLLFEPSPEKAVAAFREAAKTARSSQPWQYAFGDYVTLSTRAAEAEVRAGHDPVAAVASIEAIGDELAKQDRYEEAANAYLSAGNLDVKAAHAEGTSTMTRLRSKRLDVLAKTKDPLRSATAKVDLVSAIWGEYWHRYRGGAKAMLAQDPRFVALESEIEATARALASAGRTRDGARLLGYLRGTNKDPALVEGLRWAESFKDSAEYPPLAANLLSARANAKKDPAERARLYEEARKLYLSAGFKYEAVRNARAIVIAEEEPTEMWRAFDGCLEAAKDTSFDAECYTGLVNFLRGTKRSEPQKPRSALMRGVDRLPSWERELDSPQFFYEVLGVLVQLAATTREDATRDKLNERVRTYYEKTHPDPYQLVTHYSRVIGAARKAGDYTWALSMEKAFEAANGASCYWKAGEYPSFAADAARVGDKAAEKMFLDVGRECARPASQDLYFFDIYRSPLLKEKKDYRGLANAYRASLATIKKTMPTYALLQEEWSIAVGAAEALAKDYGGATETLKPTVTRAVREADGDASQTPCYHAYVLELDAALLRAQGACAKADEIARKAEQLRARCTTTTCYATPRNDGAEWCDRHGTGAIRLKNVCQKPLDPEGMVLP